MRPNPGVPLFRAAWPLLLLSCGVRPATEAPTEVPPYVDCRPVVPEDPPEEAIAALCAADFGSPLPEALRTPPPMDQLSAKNAYDVALRDWFRDRGYRKAGWQHDQTWRLTGPAVEPLGGATYGVHPGVRIWYSPEVMQWLCGGRKGPIADGAMLVKEMVGLDAIADGYEVKDDHWAPKKAFDPDSVEPGSWTVMVRNAAASADGWYWANPTAADGTAPNGIGNPPIVDASATMGTIPDASAPLDPHWYPTGVDFADAESQPSMVYPYNAYGAYCLNCHASAESQSTFSSFENLLTEGARYTRLRPGQACTQWSATPSTKVDEAPQTAFQSHRTEPDPVFTAFYDQLEPVSLADAWPHRFPAETWDHVVADGSGRFPTSDQCIGCHDATVSNSRVPHMVLEEKSADATTKRNLSPYGEWRASPMGLAGRDPVFFSQLASETNHLPEELAACVESTCLRCHGAMGARQKARDTALDENPCAALYGEPPPDAVVYGEPFRREALYRWPGDPGEGAEVHYAAQGRDGISCAVCHRISEDSLDENRSFTGNWVPGPDDTINGPFSDIAARPMENALGLKPAANPVIQKPELCGTCHNILLPVFAEDGTPWVDEGQASQAFRYEQSTHLEWQNSAFSDPETGRTCQDCHMPHDWQGTDLDFPIANIEDQTFPRTTHALAIGERTVPAREDYRRHALHGLNLTLNQLFQQFPLLLGVRQSDYMVGDMVPSLVTAKDSMLHMARNETATVTVGEVTSTEAGVEATVRVESLAGHYLPSGVGFRRLILQVEAVDANGAVVWASGRTNALGAVVDGLTDEVLAFERPIENPTAYEPHHQRIERMDQVQLYEEVVLGSDGNVNTSFLRRVELAKDNRIRPRGHDPKKFEEAESKFVRALAHEGPADDPDYTDPERTGADELVYAMELPADVARPVTVRATLFSQTVPPAYLQHRFADASVGAAEATDIQRLYALTSHLSTEGEAAFLDQWKVALASGESTEPAP